MFRPPDFFAGSWCYTERLMALIETLRYSQPFNRLATGGARALLRGLGLRSAWCRCHLHRVGRIEAPLPNGRTLLLQGAPDDAIPNQIYWDGWDGFEPEASSVFFALAATARVTLDVGAYVGYYALLAAHANPRGRVVAFEPLPAIYERFRRNVNLNRLDNIDGVMSAVGRDGGTATFYHVDRPLPSSSSLSYAFMQHAPGLISSRVPVVTVDRYAAEHRLDSVDLVKIDTESTEPDILAGMAETLRRHHPHILCEVLAEHDTGPRLQVLLQPHGYRYYLLTGEGPVPRERITGHSEWRNYLFTTLGPEAIPAMAGALRR